MAANLVALWRSYGLSLLREERGADVASFINKSCAYASYGLPPIWLW
jgi:hypothetical protein